jgi:Polyketide cyclase / dehydrase and lipid transport
MHTNVLGRSETRAISIDAPPEVILDLVSDARSLPSWAPAFAESVETAGQDWLITTATGQFSVRLEVSRKYGVVDFTRPGDPARGARMRVLANEGGSEFVFTLIFPPGASDDAVAQQMTIVEAELRAVRDICEREPRGHA